MPDLHALADQVTDEESFILFAAARRRAFFQTFPPAFGLLWRGRDGIARAGVGQAGVGPHDKHVAEVRFAPLKAFEEEQHLELLGIFDGAGTRQRQCQDEQHLRELLVLAHLDGPT
jgi:hypothetical protein